VKIKNLDTPWNRFVAWIDMFFVDHGFVRNLYNNFYALSDKMYRSSQPAPFQVRRYKQKYGIKTIINLRGENTFGSYHYEKEACEKEGLHFVNFRVYSRRMPSKKDVLGAKALLESIEYPANLHCKSGADRAGLMATLYMIFQEQQPVEEAIKQLDWKYGHFKQAKTGILDHFFQCYLDYNKETPTEFLDWVENIYDEQACTESFHSSWWWNNVVDKILRRE